MKLSFAKFSFLLKARENILLHHFSGSTFRGAFGTILKKTVCIRPPGEQTCETCFVRHSCVYSYIFETPQDNHKEEGRFDFNYAPHPFVFEPPVSSSERVFKAGDHIPLNLILIGKGLQYLPYFVYTFETMGITGIGPSRGKYDLHSITVESSDGLQTIYDGQKGNLKRDYRPFEFTDFAYDVAPREDVTLDFTTSVRIKHNGRLASNLDFQLIMVNLLRRISALAQYHGEGEVGVDIKGLLKRSREVKTVRNATRWVDLERYSFRQRRRMKLGGLVGQISFEGQMQEFLPFLKVGEFVHVGKSTSFGLGKYEFI